MKGINPCEGRAALPEWVHGMPTRGACSLADNPRVMWAISGIAQDDELPSSSCLKSFDNCTGTLGKRGCPCSGSVSGAAEQRMLRVLEVL